jgi:hypothetical protein
MKFIKISGTVFDYSNYKLTVSNTVKLLNDEIESSIIKLGFVKQKENIFYNKKMDLLLEISIRNRSKLKFV